MKIIFTMILIFLVSACSSISKQTVVSKETFANYVESELPLGPMINANRPLERFFARGYCNELFTAKTDLKAPLTRIEMSACLGMYLQTYLGQTAIVKNIYESPYQDIPAGSYYLPYVHQMVSSGIILPYSPTKFGVAEVVTGKELNFAIKRINQRINHKE